MTLADFPLPVSYEWGVAHALVFDAALAQRLAEVQGQHGDPRHVPAPQPMEDGRFFLAADILTECLPGGLVYGGFSQLDAGRFNEIEVVPLAAVLALLADRLDDDGSDDE
jgi:hypothetical protein